MKKKNLHVFNTAMEDEAPSSRSRKTLNHDDDPFVESNDDVLVAARSLMQLSDDDNNNNNNNNDKNDDDGVVGRWKRVSFSSEEEVDQRIESNETIGDDINEIDCPKKKKKYRSLAIIYMETKPIITHSEKEKSQR